MLGNIKMTFFCKILLFVLALLCNSAFGQACSEGEILEGAICKIIDPRDKHEYKVVKINGQVWMAENLNYISGDCFNREIANCDKYGRLYDWKTARKACPSGWHLPAKAEWDKLIKAIDEKIAGRRLRARIWAGADDYEFSALPGGYRLASNFLYNGTTGNWWTDTDESLDCRSGQAVYKQMGSGFDEVLEYCNDKTNFGFSVRCIKNGD